MKNNNKMQESFHLYIIKTTRKNYVHCAYILQRKKMFYKITSCEQKVNKLNFHSIFMLSETGKQNN